MELREYPPIFNNSIKRKKYGQAGIPVDTPACPYFFNNTLRFCIAF
jgi:hypothetical protein